MLLKILGTLLYILWILSTSNRHNWKSVQKCHKLHDFEIFFNTKIAFAQHGKYIGKLLQYSKFTSKIGWNMVSSIEISKAICAILLWNLKKNCMQFVTLANWKSVQKCFVVGCFDFWKLFMKDILEFRFCWLLMWHRHWSGGFFPRFHTNVSFRSNCSLYLNLLAVVLVLV